MVNHNRSLIRTCLEAERFEIKASGESLLPDLQTAIFSVSSMGRELSGSPIHEGATVMN